jgi:hypothetical protein
MRSRAHTADAHTRRLTRHGSRRNEGVVLVVILLIIVITTAAAAVSIQNTTGEVRASGREMMMVQARYSAEASLVTTMAWIDILDTNLSMLWADWQELPPPDMRRNTGGHLINNDASRFGAARVHQQTAQLIPMNVLPVSRASLTDPIPDPTGSFGPSQVYDAAPFEVDITECVMAPPTAGNQSSQNQSNSTPERFFCVLTVRNRLEIAGGAGSRITWLNVGPSPPPAPWLPVVVIQDRTGVAHDARATILTPTVLLN